MQTILTFCLDNLLHTSHLCGEIKTKVKPLIASMYGFEVPTSDTICAHNCELVMQLKEGYLFLYKVCQTLDIPFHVTSYNILDAS